jgi:hypothetical protein
MTANEKEALQKAEDELRAIEEELEAHREALWKLLPNLSGQL